MYTQENDIRLNERGKGKERKETYQDLHQRKGTEGNAV